MRRMKGPVWPYLLLVVALVGASAFGWYQTQQKNQLALDAENKYMSAFHRLKWTSENIEERTARLMATNDPRLQQSLLADLRVFTAQAVEYMAVLPMLTMNTPRIENFLNTLRDHADLTHEKVTEGQALSDADWSKLTELRKQAVFFEDELSTLAGLVGSGVIRWRETVRVTGPAETGTAATPITQSIAQLDNRLAPPPGEENALAPQAGPLRRPRTDPGPRVDVATAVANIKKFVDMPLQGEPRLNGTSDPQDKLHTASLYFFDARKVNNTPLSFGVSVHGGHIMFMMDGRQVLEKRLTKADLIKRAQTFLENWGYRDTTFVSAVENDGTMVLDFAPIKDGVAVEVDKLKVMLAMDNGELVGFDARSYWINRHARSLAKPKLAAADAIKRVSPRLKAVGQPRLMVIADRRFRERLTWEVQGSVDDQFFRLFVDAATGQEVDLQRVSGDPAPPINR